MRAAALLPTLLAGLALTACSQPEPAETPAPAVAPGPWQAVTVSDGWCRETSPGAKNGACYLTIANPNSEAERLTGFTTAAAGRPEVHTMSMEGGIMKMARLEDGLEIPGGGTATLKPGAEHLMLIDLAAPLTPGQDVTLALEFQRSGPIGARLPVRSLAEGAPPAADAAN